MQNIHDYLKENKEIILNQLFNYLKIPSVSSKSEHKADMYRAAEFLKAKLLDAGCSKAEIFETDGNPVTYGELVQNHDWPTVLVYGHMDVMPAEPFELWKSQPFNPIIKDDKIYARGADDDKGQSFMQIAAFEYLVKNGLLRCNVKFMIEGEEEIGSSNLPVFCQANKDMLAADVILVSDTSMISSEMPSITTGLRGIAYWQVEVTGPDHDLHSGVYGGAVANPVNELVKLLARCTNENHQIMIPHFYDKVKDISVEERNLLANAPFNQDNYKREIGVTELQGEVGFTTRERTGIRPSFDVCGIWGGYTGEGAKTIIPSKVFAKVSCRLVPDQDFHEIEQLLARYLNQIAPKTIKVEVKPLHGGAPYVCPIDFPAYKAAEQACLRTFGVKPLPVRSGGSIPVITVFEQILGIKSILLGFGLSSDAIHSPNENFPLNSFFKGIETIVAFYDEFAK